jgi:hypothetical protein
MPAGTVWAAISGTFVRSSAQEDFLWHGISFNGKFFICYMDTASDRLKVYDPGTNTERKVGIYPGAAAPTVANQGGGAYAAVLRYYRIRFAAPHPQCFEANTEVLIVSPCFHERAALRDAQGRDAPQRLPSRPRIDVAQRLFEYWAHAACLVPTTMLPWWRRAMLDYRLRHTGWSDWLRRNPKILGRVRAAVSTNGPMGSSDFEGRRPKGGGGWWSWSPVRHALHYLWMTGALTIHSRQHFHKRFAILAISKARIFRSKLVLQKARQNAFPGW